MKKLLLAVAGSVILWASPYAGCQTTWQATVLSRSQPMPGVEIVVMLANKNKVASATTGPNGAATMAVNLANLGKIHVDVVEDEQCPNGQTYVTITAHGQQPDDNGCKKRRRIIAILIDGSGNVQWVIDVGYGTVQVTPTVGGAAATSALPIGLQAGGGIGLDILSGVNSCAAITATFSGATCSTGNKSFAFDVGAALTFLKYFALEGTYLRGNTTTRSASASSFSATDSAQPQYQTINGTVGWPLGRFRIFGGGGINFYQFHFTEVQSQTTQHFNVNGHGPMATGGVQIGISHRVAVQIRDDYLIANSQTPLDAHDNKVMFRVIFTLF